jgi:hypothetical protein
VVPWAFLLESSFVAVGGILLGTALSLVTTAWPAPPGGQDQAGAALGIAD